MVKYDTTPDTDAISAIDFTGNIIPPIWYQKIRIAYGSEGRTKPDLYAINLLADIVYWYRNSHIRDEKLGSLVEVKKKFGDDYLQRSYKQIAEFFGLSKRSAMLVVKRLKDMGLVETIVKDKVITDSGKTIHNVLYIRPIAENIETLQKDVVQFRTVGRKPNGNEVVKECSLGQCNSVHHPSEQVCHTNTETTDTEIINTETSSENPTGDYNLTATTTPGLREGKKRKSSRKGHLKTSQIDADVYPYAHGVMEALQDILNKHIDAGGNNGHCVMMSGDRQLVVNPDHLYDIDERMSELIEAECDGDNYYYQAARKLISIYVMRSHYQQNPVNMAYLAGVNMPNDYGGEMEPWEYVGFVRDTVAKYEIERAKGKFQ